MFNRSERQNKAKLKEFFNDTKSARADSLSTMSTSFRNNNNNSTRLTVYNSTLIESFEITTPDLFIAESSNPHKFRHTTLQAQRKHQCKKRRPKSKSFSTLPASSYSESLDHLGQKRDSYDIDALIKRLSSEGLDRELHFEFLEMRNYPANKSFKDSLKIPNERKSRYKYIYPYDDNRIKLDLLKDRPDSDFINASYIQGYNKPRKFIAAQGLICLFFYFFFQG
jgi:hypothetical protein